MQKNEKAIEILKGVNLMEESTMIDRNTEVGGHKE